MKGIAESVIKDRDAMNKGFMSSPDTASSYFCTTPGEEMAAHD